MLIRSNSSRTDSRIVYLNAWNGEFRRANSKKKESYRTVIGSVEGIFCRSYTDRNGEEFRKWHLIMRDGNELYDISFPYDCQAIRTTVCSLMTEEALSHLDRIKIKAYGGNGRKYSTKVSVFVDDERVHYPDDMIPSFRDFKERDRRLHQLADELGRLISEGGMTDRCRAQGGQPARDGSRDPYDEFISGGRDFEERDYEKDYRAGRKVLHRA